MDSECLTAVMVEGFEELSVLVLLRSWDCTYSVRYTAV